MSYHYTILELKNTTCAGSDEIPKCVLKQCASILCYPLSILFNQSLSSGCFPNLWKESFIIPIHKAGNKSDISNYRGISALNIIPKLFEKIVTDQITQQITTLISPAQHGFLKGKSTATNLLTLASDINHGFVKGAQTDVIYTDFSKAFDCVNHELLLLKLDMIGLPSYLINWLRSYLTDRSQRVKFNNTVSNPITVTSGVPQGSHIGPILFLIYINDLTSVIKSSKILMFADDVKLYNSFNSQNGSVLLQNDLNSISIWCTENLMNMNIKKCKHMTFNRGSKIQTEYFIDSTRLEIVDSFKDLGVIMDPKLRFNIHINNMINKGASMLGFIKRWAKDFNDPYTTKLLFTSLVRPILEYASVVWNPQYETYVTKIESIQKQFLLFALRNFYWDTSINLPSYSSRLKLINLPSLQSRRTVLSVTFLHKLIYGDVVSETLLAKISINVPSRRTRYYEFIRLKTCTNNYGNFDPFRVLCVLYNHHYYSFESTDSCDSIKRSLTILLN